ncbi:hypothetical protein KSS87_019824 [Heliosperma pusillum]|nr:hypothetical protein KSS87_019824 [Heliosperma pusillum]
MTDRYFANNMPQYVPEISSIVTTTETETNDNSLLDLLSTDYKSFSLLLERLALDIKETVVIETWGRTGQKVVDFSLYAGTLGTAFLLFKAYQVTKNVNDLYLCLEIVKACDLASSGSRDVTFICGRAGVYALGAVVAKHMGDEPLMKNYLTQFKQINLPRDVPNELLYGRAGFLWTCLFLNKHVGDGTISSTLLRSIASDIIEDGRRMPNKGSWPLMFEWYGNRYWGAAHGFAGILHVLMDTELKPDELKDVKNELLCMVKHRFSSGNFPASEEDKGRDVLVHWCHGAPGVALTLVKAYEVFKDNMFLDAAIEAAEVVWNRGMLKRVGICHGISGNAYVFLSLYRATGNMCYLYKAKAFASFLINNATKLIAAGEMHGGDNPYSLFEGIGGMAYLFLDMIEPTCSRFPAYEL